MGLDPEEAAEELRGKTSSDSVNLLYLKR